MFKRDKSFHDKNKLPPRTRSGTYVLSTRRLQAPAAAALMVLVAFCAHFPSLNCGFIWDDNNYLTENPIIKASDGMYRFWFTTQPFDYYPASNTTLWIEWRLWGMNATGYHLTNLALHIVESLLIWIILAKLSVPGGFLAAPIFVG